MARRPNILLILVDDLRFDEFGAGGHPYMKTPHADRIAHGALRAGLSHHAHLL
jgi:N-acetylglucosamine-6-sulfatase